MDVITLGALRRGVRACEEVNLITIDFLDILAEMKLELCI